MLPKDGLPARGVRESSLMILNGSHDRGWLDVCLEIAGDPLLTDAEQRDCNEYAESKAAVVESEPVGGVKPGMTMHTLQVPMNRNSVPGMRDTSLARQGQPL